MASVKDHYDQHLAPLYTWMRGGAEAPRKEFAEFLRAHSLLSAKPGATALDLGAGSGFQTLPLAAAGFAVTAIDVSEVLTAELTREAAALKLPVRVVLGDICDLARHAPKPAPELIVCCGDTLTHLASVDQVARLLTHAALTLAAGGHLVLTYRDYSVARSGADRFILVRSDADRIFTCFLDFGPTNLTVHDLLHTRTAEGWKLAVSTYEKVRLAPDLVRECLRSLGLTLVHDNLLGGLHTVIARKSP
jgi:SAM-dependent methyltransferase